MSEPSGRGNAGGSTADLLQWAAVHAMVLGVVGLFALIIIERNLT